MKLSLSNLLRPRRTISGDGVHVADVTLSEKGVLMVVIDHEHQNNKLAIQRLQARRAAIMRDLRDCDEQLRSYQLRQDKLQAVLGGVDDIPVAL